MISVLTVLSSDDSTEWEQIKAFLALTSQTQVLVDDEARSLTSLVQASWCNPQTSGDAMAANITVVDL